MKCNHAVVQKVGLPLGDDLHAALSRHKCRQLAKMRSNEIPYAFLGTFLQLKSLLKSPVRLVCGNDEVLLYGSARDLSIGALFLVQRAHIGNDKSRCRKCLLDGSPYSVLRIVEDHGHPPTRLEHAAVF